MLRTLPPADDSSKPRLGISVHEIAHACILGRKTIAPDALTDLAREAVCGDDCRDETAAPEMPIPFKAR